jgi:hypothetical protein
VNLRIDAEQFYSPHLLHKDKHMHELLRSLPKNILKIVQRQLTEDDVAGIPKLSQRWAS